MGRFLNKNKQKKKDKVFSDYPCSVYLHNALTFIANNKADVAYEEICWALLKSGAELTSEEQTLFNNIRENNNTMFDDSISKYIKFINTEEFQEKILGYINSGEIDKAISDSVFKDKPEYKSAIIYGMTIASMLTSCCESFSIKIGDKLREKNNEVSDDGLYLELFAVKDGVRCNLKVVSMKDVAHILTDSLMDGIEKMWQ